MPLVAAALGWLPGQALGRRASAICAEATCRTVAANTGVRVFVARRYAQRRIRYEATFARWSPSGRTTALGDEFNEGDPGRDLGQLTLAGRFVGFALVSYGGYNEEGAVWSIVRLDASTGRREVAQTSPTTAGEDLEEGCVGGLAQHSPGITQVVATAGGTVAWILGRIRVVQEPHQLTYVVCELQPDSRRSRRLASGATIGPTSLAATPGLLYWTEGSVARSAKIG